MNRVWYMMILFFLFCETSFGGTNKSFVVIDVDTDEILIEEKADTKQQIASLTKIWTALLVLEKSNLDTMVVVSKNASFQRGSSIHLKESQIISVRDLLYGLLLRSGNDAAVALAEHISGSEKEFVKLMNRRLKEEKIEDTNFVDASGLKNNTSTAKDVAKMFKVALNNPKFKGISSRLSYKNSIDGELWINKHKLLGNSGGFTAFSGKTGYTKVAGRTLATAFYYNKKQCIVVSLNEKDDWNLHQTLAHKVLDR